MLGTDVTEFTPRLAALGQPGAVQARGWDVKQKKEVNGQARGVPELMGGTKTGGQTAKAAFGARTDVTVDVPVRVQAYADAVAQGRYQQAALSFVRGEATGPGRPALRPGTVVSMTGAGRTFSGSYYVTSVTHTLDPQGGFRTSFEVRRSGS
jgi:phage protein D